MRAADGNAIELAGKHVAGGVKATKVAVAAGRQSTIWPLDELKVSK